MSDVFLGIIIFALAAFFVIQALARRSTPAADAVGDPVVREPECDLGGGSRDHAPLPDPDVWQSATVSDLSSAEELLDAAEATGFTEREMVVLGESLFLVRWRGRA